MPRLRSLVAPAAALAALCACGGEPASLKATPTFNHGVSALSFMSSANGLSTNGLSTNGMSTNGLSTNGLSTNGLSTNGLSTNGFSSWFALDTNYANMVMKYVARCALAAGKTLTYSYNGVTYNWPGNLGLATSWASGNPATTTEMQLVSACLAAHANKYGVEMAISVRGVLPSGSLIPITTDEAATFINDEGCFFGNLFDGTGVFSTYSINSPLASSGETSLRACVANGGYYGDCPPMVDMPYQAQYYCSGGSASTLSYKYCNGYRAICTRLRSADIASCGDGVCAPSENASTCPADCH